MVKRNSNGFSAVEIVIAVFVVLTLGIGGWYVWQKHDAKPLVSTKKDSTSESKSNQSTDLSEGGKYFVIKEWGLRFPLPEELKNDVKSGMLTRTDPSGSSQYLYFTSRTLADLSPSGMCDITPAKDANEEGFFGGTIAIARYTTDPSEGGERVVYQSGGYWYTVSASNGGPCDGDEGGMMRGRFNVLMGDAFKHLEAIK